MKLNDDSSSIFSIRLISGIYALRKSGLISHSMTLGFPGSVLVHHEVIATIRVTFDLYKQVHLISL